MKIDIFKKNIGQNIRKLRISNGLTQEDFCKKNLLKTAKNLSSIEKGRTLPTLITILNICENNSVSADSLLWGHTNKALENDNDKMGDAKLALKQTLDNYNRLLRDLEGRIEHEIKEAEEKREGLLLSLEALRAGHFTPGPGQDLSSDLRFVKSYLEFLQKDLEAVKDKDANFLKNKEILLGLFS